eukprot:m.52813 g.52813  ORF g.52813 m.52813 type:complete len:528 (+) comp12734_c1_seq6:754-2337(+)
MTSRYYKDGIKACSFLRALNHLLWLRSKTLKLLSHRLLPILYVFAATTSRLCPSFSYLVLRQDLMFSAGVCQHVIAGKLTLRKYLPRRAMSQVNIKRYRAQSSTAILHDVVSTILMSPMLPVKLGPTPLKELLDAFLFQDLSVSMVLKGVNMSLFNFFTRNPAAILNSMNPTDRPEMVSNDILGTAGATTTAEALKHLQEERNREQLVSACVCALQSLAQGVPDLPAHPITKDIMSWLAECSEHLLLHSPMWANLRRILGVVSETTLLAKIQACADVVDTRAKLLQSLPSTYMEYYCNGAKVLHDVAKELRDLAKAPPVQEEAVASAEAMETTLPIRDPSTSVVDLLATGVRRSNRASKAAERRSILQSRAVTAATHDARLRDRRDQILNKLEHILKRLRPCYQHPAMLYMDMSLKLQLNGPSRVRRQQHLRKPAIQNQLASSEDEYSGLPDLSVAYRLHLECGRLINLHDWLMAFASIVEPEQEHEPSAGVQARFARAVAELQFLGFIKATRRKPDHVERLTWWRV